MREMTINEVERVSGGVEMNKENAGDWATYYASVGGVAAATGAEPLAVVAFTMAAGFALWSVW